MGVHFEVGLTTGSKITAEMKRLEADNEEGSQQLGRPDVECEDLPRVKPHAV